MKSFWRFCQVALALICTVPAWAQGDYPNRPVRVIIPYPPGAGTDLIARPVAEQLSRALGQQYVVEHRSGAGGALGAEALAKSPPDGYTLMITPQAPIVVLPYLRKVGYDPVKDIIPIARMSEVVTGIVVHPSLGVRTLQEYVALARQKPGYITYVSGGAGTITHLRAELFKLMAGIDVLHIPYRGNGEAIPDLLAGNVHTMIEAVVFPHVKAGKLVLLAILDNERHPDFPDTPTMKEAGFPEYDLPIWFGTYAPAGTPRPIIERLHNEIARIQEDDALRAKLAVAGMRLYRKAEPLNALNAYVVQQTKVLTELIEKANIKVD